MTDHTVATQAPTPSPLGSSFDWGLLAKIAGPGVFLFIIIDGSVAVRLLAAIAASSAMAAWTRLGRRGFKRLNHRVANPTVTAGMRRLSIAAVAAFAMMFMSAFLPTAVTMTAFWLLLVASLWFFPPAAIAVLVAAAAMWGGSFLLLTPVVAVLSARRWSRMALDEPRSVRHTGLSAAWALLALLLALMFANVATDPQGGGSGGDQAGQFGQSTAVESSDAPASVSDGVIARIIRAIFGEGDPANELDGVTPGADGAPASGQPPEPPSDFNIWPWLIALAVLLVIAALIWWWRRRRKSQALTILAARPLARLEALGKSVGEPREPNEGALTYARRLRSRTGDHRLAGTGSLVSSEIYESRSIDPTYVDNQLSGLEAAPPTVSKVPLRVRLGSALGSLRLQLRLHWRGALLSLAGVVAALALTVWAITSLGSL